MERDFFGPRAAKTRKRRRSPHNIESSGAQWGRIKEGEDRSQARTFESGTWSKEIAWKDKKTWIEWFSTPSPVGRRIEAPLGAVPPPNVFGVRRFAIRKGV